MFRFSSTVAAAAALFILIAGVTVSGNVMAAGPKPGVAKAGKKPAKAKPAKGKSAKAAKAKPAKEPKRQAKVNVKSSLGQTDKLIKVAQKTAGKRGHNDLREASVQQLAARKALAAGKERQAMFLSLEARRVARGIITDTGGKIPKGMDADKMEETDNSDALEIEPFVTEAQEEIPEAIDDHEPSDMDGEGDSADEIIEDSDVDY